MIDKHEHLDEGTIHAWLDGVLSPDESARVETLAAACDECAALVAEARGLVAASSRILSSLDTIPGGVIPGADGGVDQLAALRARRSATTRRWWSDRRIVAAASLVIVAGVSSVVWRFAGTDTVTSPAEQTVDAVRPFADSAPAVVTAPSAPATPGAKARNESKAEAPPQVREAAPMRLTAAKVDSAPDMKSDMKKVAAASTALPRSADVAANEVRRADSIAILPNRQARQDSVARRDVAERPAFEKQQIQQQGTAQGQQSLRQASAERARIAAAPPALAAGSRLQVVTTGVGAASDAVLSPIGCYELRQVLDANARTSLSADTVRLLDDQIQERGDLSWQRAQRVGGRPQPPAAMSWRQVDSVTVELRTRNATDSSTTRFLFRGVVVFEGGSQVVVRVIPEKSGLTGVRSALALKIDCP